MTNTNKTENTRRIQTKQKTQHKKLKRWATRTLTKYKSALTKRCLLFFTITGTLYCTNDSKTRQKQEQLTSVNFVNIYEISWDIEMSDYIDDLFWLHMYMFLIHI
jgi:hypothetical protein